MPHSVHTAALIHQPRKITSKKSKNDGQKFVETMSAKAMAKEFYLMTKKEGM